MAWRPWSPCGIHYLSGFSACQPCQDFRFKWFCGPKMARKNPQSFPPVTKNHRGSCGARMPPCPLMRETTRLKTTPNCLAKLKRALIPLAFKPVFRWIESLSISIWTLASISCKAKRAVAGVNQLLNGYRETYVALSRHARVLGQESLGHAPPLWERQGQAKLRQLVAEIPWAIIWCFE